MAPNVRPYPELAGLARGTVKSDNPMPVPRNRRKKITALATNAPAITARHENSEVVATRADESVVLMIASFIAHSPHFEVSHGLTLSGVTSGQPEDNDNWNGNADDPEQQRAHGRSFLTCQRQGKRRMPTLVPDGSAFVRPRMVVRAVQWDLERKSEE